MSTLLLLAACGGPSGATPADALNGCSASDYVDRTGADASRVVSFSGVTYSPACITILAGQSVTFSGSFSTHPLVPGKQRGEQESSPANPIPQRSSGTEETVRFELPGLFPYFCSEHLPTMLGVVQVR